MKSFIWLIHSRIVVAWLAHDSSEFRKIEGWYADWGK